VTLSAAEKEVFNEQLVPVFTFEPIPVFGGREYRDQMLFASDATREEKTEFIDLFKAMNPITLFRGVPLLFSRMLSALHGLR